MRILACHPGPHFSVHDVFVGWTEAFRDLGARVARYNLDDRLTFYDTALVEISGDVKTHGLDTFRVDAGDKIIKIRKALNSEQAHELAINGLYAELYKMRPDVLFLVSAFFVPLKLLDLARSYGTKVVILHTESPYEDERQLTYASHADVSLLNDPINLKRFQSITTARYMPHAYRPSVHHPGTPDPQLASDFAFVGTGFASRIDFFESMDFGNLDVMLAGNWQQLDDDSPLMKYVAHDSDECLDNEQTAEIYRSAKVGINFYRREAERPELSEGWALGPREVEMAACGMFFLRDPRPEGDEVFPMLPTFTTPEEASEQLKWWLGRPARRAELANEARLAIKDRTFVNHAKQLLQDLGA